MAFFDNSICWENNAKMVRAMDQVVEEKDPLNCVTLNGISVTQLERICSRLCNKKHQIIVLKPQEFLQWPANVILKPSSEHCSATSTTDSSLDKVLIKAWLLISSSKWSIVMHTGQIPITDPCHCSRSTVVL